LGDTEKLLGFYIFGNVMLKFLYTLLVLMVSL